MKSVTTAIRFSYSTLHPFFLLLILYCLKNVGWCECVRVIYFFSLCTTNRLTCWLTGGKRKEVCKSESSEKNEKKREKKREKKEKQETKRTDVKRVDCAQPCTQQEEKKRHSNSSECHFTQKNRY